MQYEFVNPGPFVMLKVKLEMGETIKAEAGAMIAMSDTIDVEARFQRALDLTGTLKTCPTCG
jgi:uncharacterized protein (AIM24 family)